MKIRWLLAVLVVGGAIAIFFAACEKREITVPAPRSGEAADNRYFAAIRVLRAMGLEARSERDPSALARLPATDGTVFLPTARASILPEQSARLLDWVESGGHLVIVTYQLWDDRARQADPLLDPLGFRQFTHEPEAAAAPVDLEKEPKEPKIPLAYSQAIPGREKPLEVEFSPAFYFAALDEADPLLDFESPAGHHLFTVRQGAGFVTGMTDDVFMTTDRLDELDHAELVYRLATLEGRRGEVLWVFGDDFPSLWKLLLRYAWMVALGLAVLVAVWLAHAAPRFGPLARDPALDRRDLMEHVRASGRFQWRHGAGAQLRADVRAALLARVARRHPAWLGLDPARQAEKLAEASGLPHERVLGALATTQTPALDKFVAEVSILERIRRSL